MRTIVFCNHAMGDVIMAWPLLRAAVAEPDDAALAITKSDYEAEVVRLGATGPGRIRCLGLRTLASGGPARFVRLVAALRRHRADAAALIYGIEPWRGGILSLLSGARVRVGPKAPLAGGLFSRHLPFDESATPPFHKVQYHCRAAALLGRHAEPNIRAELPGSEAMRLGDSLLEGAAGPWVGVGLGCGSDFHKRLPAHLGVELVTRLCETYPDVSLVLLGGPAEAELNHTLREAPGFRGLDLTGRTTVRGLLAVLQRVRVTVANCNGVAHMTAAAGRPVVGLFGPTNPDLTGPFGVPVTIISRNLDCSPCYRRGFVDGCGDPRCMNLDVGEIVAAVGDYVHGHRERRRVRSCSRTRGCEG